MKSNKIKMGDKTIIKPPPLSTMKAMLEENIELEPGWELHIEERSDRLIVKAIAYYYFNKTPNTIRKLSTFSLVWRREDANDTEKFIEALQKEINNGHDILKTLSPIKEEADV